jgi:hypothetical protein
MIIFSRSALALAFTLFVLALSARAQTPRMSAVNITPDTEKIRIASVGDVYQMTVEVSDEQGEVVFQSGQLAGQALDWKMKDASGWRVHPGTYLVTATYRASNGKLKKRVEQVTVEEAVTTASATRRPSSPSRAAWTSSGGSGPSASPGKRTAAATSDWGPKTWRQSSRCW